MSQQVIVIGSGFSSLSAACYLARAGYAVTVLEKNSGPGGRARIWEQDGYRFDMGPSWYWMPEVFEQFFQDFGFQVADFYQLKRLNPSYRVYFQGEYIDVPADPLALEALFEQREPGAGIQLRAFLEDARYKYETAMREYVERLSDNLWEFVDVKLLIKTWQMQLLSSLRTKVRNSFRDPALVAILEFPVLFLGSTPDRTPAMYSMMNYADLQLGTWYPQGGMHEIVKGMVAVAEKLGVVFRFNEPVKKIDVVNGKARQVITDQQTYAADWVVAGADYAHVEQKLLEARWRQYDEAYWNSREMSPSSLLYYLGVNRSIPELLHHTLFFDEDFDRHAAEIYTTPQWPSKPLFYVCTASKTDNTVAPVGHENVFLLMPLAVGIQDNEGIREKYFQLMMDRLEARTGVDIRHHIVLKRSFCIHDFEKDYHSFKGNAYGLANSLRQTAFLKPKMKSPKVNNLYYTGQLTVPGPGVPPAIISGRIAAREICLRDK